MPPLYGRAAAASVLSKQSSVLASVAVADAAAAVVVVSAAPPPSMASAPDDKGVHVDVEVDVAPKKDEEDRDGEEEEDRLAFLLDDDTIEVEANEARACAACFGGEVAYRGESGGGCESGGLQPMNVPGKSLV